MVVVYVAPVDTLDDEGRPVCSRCGILLVKGNRVKGYCKPCFVREYGKQHEKLPSQKERSHQGWERWYYNAENHKAVLARKAAYDKLEKVKMIEAYGGKCVCCGEAEPAFLSIDHVFGGGIADRRRNGDGANFYRVLRLMGYPKDKYRLLCLNCNFAIGHYGYCPHNPDTMVRGESSPHSRILSVEETNSMWEAARLSSAEFRHPDELQLTDWVEHGVL